MPRLGSTEDQILRRFMVRRSGLEILRTKITADMAVQSSSDQGVTRAIRETFSKYVKMATWADIYEESSERNLHEEYLLIKDLRPVITKDSQGNLSVKGI